MESKIDYSDYQTWREEVLLGIPDVSIDAYLRQLALKKLEATEPKEVTE